MNIPTVFKRTAALLCLLCAMFSETYAQLSFGKAQLFNDGWLFTLTADSVAFAPSRLEC